MNNKTQLGMTLLEVLVAMTLMVIISAMAFASLNGLIDAKIQTDDVANKLRYEVLTSQQLQKDFRSMIKREIKDEFGGVKPAVIGNFSSIEFSKNGHDNPLGEHRSDLQRVQWYLRDKKLFRRSINQMDIGSFPKWQVRKYLDDVDEINISYVNSTGKESRFWPLENKLIPLRYVYFNIIFADDTSLKYIFRPIL